MVSIVNVSVFYFKYSFLEKKLICSRKNKEIKIIKRLIQAPTSLKIIKNTIAIIARRRSSQAISDAFQ
jgi:hypothetical protein